VRCRRGPASVAARISPWTRPGRWSSRGSRIRSRPERDCRWRSTSSRAAWFATAA